MRKGFLAIVAAMGMVGVSSVTHAQAPNDYLIAKFKGRSGAASEDQRVDEHALRS
ncbi:hypothetical protein [Sphingopyxis sp. QXT-31]|uniref:hypothetical protein n=1 Tax=Sphingopyxis sp. QXT-31 TaxID=1357916 RepID=UPI0012EB2CBD|nr:hypothetical protein [Sphingopyxis sp. QXT-31]